MTELSERSGVPIPTIRYYLREGLLPPGNLTSPNQATYDDAHVHRLTLIRALVEVGEMPIAAVGRLFSHLQEKDADEYVTLGLTQYALVRTAAPESALDDQEAADIQELLDRLGWQVNQHHPARATLASAVRTLRRLGQEDVLGLLEEYAAAAHDLAESEVGVVLERNGLDSRAEAVVTIGVLGDAALAALRRLAEEDVMTRALKEPSAATENTD
jgi:DNA-binding transcriptional MerR regulator